TGHFLQIPARNPDGVAGRPADLAVIILSAQQLNPFARGQGADDAVAVGWPAANIGIQAVADPAFVAGGFLSVSEAEDREQSAGKGQAPGLVPDQANT